MSNYQAFLESNEEIYEEEDLIIESIYEYCEDNLENQLLLTVTEEESEIVDERENDCTKNVDLGLPLVEGEQLILVTHIREDHSAEKLPCLDSPLEDEASDVTNSGGSYG